MKQRRIISFLLVIFVTALIVFCSTAVAYMFKQTDYKNNEFVPASVSCEVFEQFDGEKKTSIQIQNTGNINAYLRLRLVSYWVNADGNVMPKPSVMPEFNLAVGWIKGSNDTYYYQMPVLPEAYCATLLSSPITLLSDEDGCKQVVEVFAEAIQSEPANAVTDSWKVTLDSNNYIVSAP